MRLDWRQYNTGMGELLCFVLTWVIGAAIVWSDYASRTADRPGDKVAVSGAAPTRGANFD